MFIGLNMSMTHHNITYKEWTQLKYAKIVLEFAIIDDVLGFG